MIPYTRDPAKTIPPASVKIIGLGGAGANMLERIALDGMEGTQLLALNTDIRTLGACIAKDKIQLGKELTKGLGAGGDPELGNKAVLEAEEEIRASLKDHKIVFICAGLGGGTGSGAAPIVTRIAREEGAFVVVFATTPFAFEGQRRREQAETALNELAVLANALVTFDNNRMGELVLAKQGIHEAFVAADQMISESIKSVIRLVVRPGLINVGLDELMTALKTNRSRCLFGSGMATGRDRASKALRSALASPLLDEGSLLKEAQSVLVHLCGGDDLTLFEVELMMQQLQKHVPSSAQVLFGAAVDPAMSNALSVTLISALPEESLAMAPRESISQASQDSPLLEKKVEPDLPKLAPRPEPAPEPEPEPEPAPEPEPEPEPEPAEAPKPRPTAQELLARFEEEAAEEEVPAPKPAAAPKPTPAEGRTPSLFADERPFAEPEEPAPQPKEEPAPQPKEEPAPQPKEEPNPPVQVTEFRSPEPEAPAREVHPLDASDLAELEEEKDLPAKTKGLGNIPEKRPAGAAPWSPKPKEVEDEPKVKPLPLAQEAEPVATFEPEPMVEPAAPAAFQPGAAEDNARSWSDAPPESSSIQRDEESEREIPKLKLGIKPSSSGQNELSLDSAPRGRFEGEDPNFVDGEDLDLPPFLRKKK